LSFTPNVQILDDNDKLKFVEHFWILLLSNHRRFCCAFTVFDLFFAL
jgi:hypothetical protein